MSNELADLIVRIEKLEDDKALVSADIKDIYAEAKNKGYDVPAMREIVRLRKMEAEKRKQRETIVDTYKVQLNMAF